MALEKLIIEDIVEGTGPGVAAGDRISVHYTGKFEDGTVFDSSVERGEPIGYPGLGSGPHRPQEGRQTPPFDPLCSGLRRGRLSRRHSAQG